MFKELGMKLTKTGNKLGFWAKKNSPELLLGVGIAGVIGTVVLASKETLTADSIIKHHKAKLNDILDAAKIAKENPDEYDYDTTLQTTDKVIQVIKTAGSLLRCYAPAIALGTVSIGCILVSRNIMEKRYLGVVAAYNGVSEAFNMYRKRVIEDVGKDKDYEYRTGIKTVEKEIVNEDGNVETIKVKEPVDPKTITNDGISIIFDRSNPNWQKNPNLALMWLRGQETLATQMFQAKGHLFLNEVRDLLGLPDSTEGAVIGWCEGLGDNYVDFGLPTTKNYELDENGDYYFVLEFNHDAVMYDKI